MTERCDIPAIVITGPVGAGKSTTAAEVSTQLEAISVSHVLLDMDYLRWVYPAPEGDRFAAQLGHRNLVAVWPNMRAIDPRCVIIADVVESPDKRHDYERSMPGTEVVIVRLDVPLEHLRRRLQARESAETLAWYLHRAPELQGIMEREGVGDIIVNVGDRSAVEVAREILQRVGFLAG